MAMRNTQTGVRVWKSPFVLQLLIIMFITEFVKGALLISLLPVYMSESLGLSASAIGWALAAQYIGDNAFRSPLGFMIDRVGYRIVMLGGVLLTFASVILAALAVQPIWMATACLLLGAGTSPLWPCVITGTTAAAGRDASGTIMSIVYMAWLSGVGIGPIVINFFIIESYQPAFRLLVIIMTVVTVVALLLPGRSRQAAESEDEKAGEPIARGPGRERSGIAKYLRKVGRSVNASPLLYPAMFAQTMALGLLVPVLTLYARTVLGLTPQQYSYFLLAGGAITVLGLIPVGKMVDKVGTTPFLHAGFAIAAVTLPLLGMTERPVFALPIIVLVGLGFACVIPAWNALIAYAIPKEERGAVWGFFLTIEGTGTVLGSILSGFLWDKLGPGAPFFASGSVMALLFILHLFISQRRKVMIT
jgi:MFS transporter, DHA1 family, multidrug resistance protein